MVVTNEHLFDKLDELQKDIHKVHTAQAVANGKLKIHQKLIWALGGGLLFLGGLLFTHIGG